MLVGISVPKGREKNLINYPFPYAKNFNKSLVSCGLSFVDVGDGSVIINGECTDVVTYKLSEPIRIEAGKTYALSGCPLESDDSSGNYCIDACIREDPGCGPSFVCELNRWSGYVLIKHPVDAYICDMTITIYSGKFNNAVFKPQLEENNRDSVFETVKWRNVDVNV